MALWKIDSNVIEDTSLNIVKTRNMISYRPSWKKHELFT